MPNDPAATSWSATGAIIAAARAHPATAPEASGQPPFAVAMNALATVLDAGPQSWNDEPGRAQKDVLEALTAALNLLIEKQTGSQSLGALRFAGTEAATFGLRSWSGVFDRMER